MQAPGRPERVNRFRGIGRFQIMPRGPERLAEPGRELPRAALPRLAREQRRRLTRPQASAEQREQERRVGAHPVHLLREGRAVAFGARLEGRDVAGAVTREQNMRSVGPENTRRQVRMRDFEPARLEVLADRAIGGRCQEQHQRRRHHVMDEAGRGDRLRAQASADAVAAFEQHDLPALLAQHGGGDETVDPAADDHIVGARHSRDQAGTRASARTGDPVPSTNFSGAAISTAPLGGSWSSWQRLARP